MITLHHPTLNRHHTVASSHVADIYARSGWERVDADASAARHTRDELDQLAEASHVDPSRYSTKTELAEAIVDHD